jgi:prevent-host-death family protein
VQFSVREAKAQFAHAANAAANGEKVVITKHGKPFVEIVAVQPAAKGDIWERLDAARVKLALDADDYAWPDEFNDPAFSRRVMGMEE